MANLINLKTVLTFSLVEGARFVPHQAYMRGGPKAQPEFGLRKNRPNNGQVWPRPETPQRDKLGVV